MKPERAREIAMSIEPPQWTEDIVQAILQACAEQREVDAKICEGMEGRAFFGVESIFKLLAALS